LTAPRSPPVRDTAASTTVATCRETTHSGFAGISTRPSSGDTPGNCRHLGGVARPGERTPDVRDAPHHARSPTRMRAAVRTVERVARSAPGRSSLPRTQRSQPRPASPASRLRAVQTPGHGLRGPARRPSRSAGAWTSGEHRSTHNRRFPLGRRPAFAAPHSIPVPQAGPLPEESHFSQCRYSWVI
jgi:hypothetical protein